MTALLLLVRVTFHWLITKSDQTNLRVLAWSAQNLFGVRPVIGYQWLALFTEILKQPIY